MLLARRLLSPRAAISMAPIRRQSLRSVTTQTKASDLRPRMVLELEDKLWVVRVGPLVTTRTRGIILQIRSMDRVKPGKGGAFVQLELKELSGSSKTNKRFRTVDSVDTVQLDRRATFTVLYRHGKAVVLMDNTSFDQIDVDQEIFGDSLRMLTDGMDVTVDFHNDEIINVTMPSTGVYRVQDAPPLREDTKDPRSGKTVTLENGARLRAAKFIEAGDLVRVRLDDLSYIEKVPE